MPRQTVSEEQIALGVKRLTSALDMRLREKGSNSFASRHEILGVIEEEMFELNESVRNGSRLEVEEELIDIAVAAVFGNICMFNNLVDW